MVTCSESGCDITTHNNPDKYTFHSKPAAAESDPETPPDDGSSKPADCDPETPPDDGSSKPAESDPETPPDDGSSKPAESDPETPPDDGSSNPPPPPGSGDDPPPQTCGSAPPSCDNSRYRSFDGTCNNLQNPSWGTPQTPYGRLLKYNYADGVSAMAQSSSGKPLPSPRKLSLLLFPDIKLVSPLWNLAITQYGQIIAHEMSLTAGVAHPYKDQVPCCDYNGQLSPDAGNNPACAPILLSPHDPIRLAQGTKCMNFVRTGTTRDRGCTQPDAPAKPLSTVTAYIDLSVVYGNSAAQAASLRAEAGGRLQTVLRNGQEWPPQNPNVTLTCESALSPDEPCYLTGDIRVNQNPQLAVLHVMLLREHNRIADILASLNPHWNDETLFQETRRIHIAQIQHITYYEYLPILFGQEIMVKNKLIYPGVKGYVNDYNSSVDPSVLVEHATAAFRHFHTLISGHLEMIAESSVQITPARLSDWFNRPLLLEQKHNSFDQLAKGMTVQPHPLSDQWYDSEITQYLFKRNNTFGSDLRAIDIQRGRDHGLGSYVATRAACGLPVPSTFVEMLDYISPENVAILKTLYESPEDVDVVVGASIERNVPGAQAGPTFLCILIEQFYRTRAGDRYFYENGLDSVTAFKPSQLETIRKGASMARLFCDNVEGIKHIQPRAFDVISPLDVPVPCKTLPSIDFTLWQDA